jgi:hypothetical protein
MYLNQKTMKLKKVMTLALMLTVLLACGSNSEQKKESATQKNEEITTKKQQSSVTIDAFINGYLEIKDALIKDDEESASNAAGRLIPKIEALVKSEITEELQNKLQSTVEDLKTIEQASIEKQRSTFESMSHKAKEIVKLSDTDRKLYLQYCPMYANNTGGYWLSEEEQVMNPLFGSKMLKCGVVKEVIE